MRGVILVDLLQQFLQLRIEVLILEISLEVMHAAHEPFAQIRIHAASGKLAQVLRNLFTEFLGIHFGASHAQHRKLPR